MRVKVRVKVRAGVRVKARVKLSESEVLSTRPHVTLYAAILHESATPERGRNGQV